MLTNVLGTLVYELFLETFYWENDKIINIVDNLLYFSKKLCQNSKLSYYSLLTKDVKTFYISSIIHFLLHSTFLTCFRKFI